MKCSDTEKVSVVKTVSFIRALRCCFRLKLILVETYTALRSAAIEHNQFTVFMMYVFQRHETDAKMRALCKLSFAGFARFLMDKDNYAFVPEKVRQPDEVRLYCNYVKCLVHLVLLIVLALYLCMHHDCDR